VVKEAQVHFQEKSGESQKIT